MNLPTSRFWRSGLCAIKPAAALLPRVLLWVGLSVVLPQAASSDEPSTEQRALSAAQSVLNTAKEAAAHGCANPSDVLVHIMCDRKVRVGLRIYYPGFAERNQEGAFSGYEPDIARRIATFLGVDFVPVAVDPKSRIPMLANGTIDVAIATMGDTVQRDADIRFIRPHYYVSQTAVVGHNDGKAVDWEDLVGQTVCLPLGSSTNITFVRHHIRILTFDQPEQLLDALRFDQCHFIAHDDTFFVRPLADPEWAAKFAIKLRFAPIPWGMAVAHEHAAQFATLLSELSVAYHAGGVFEQLAEKHRLDLTFLRSERERWNSADCLAQDAIPRDACLIPPIDTSDAQDVSAIAPQVTRFEHAMADWFGFAMDLSSLKNKSTQYLLVEGMYYSLALIVGTQVVTSLISLALGRLMVSSVPAIRRCTNGLTSIAQVTPLPLLMFFAYILAGGIMHYSATVALVTGILAIGLYNGSNAARAIRDAHAALVRVAGEPRQFRQAVSLASVQLVAFLINAAKGSPAAGMIGVPEFLNVVTDLTASSRERFTMYLTLLVFYVSLVLIVIALLKRLRARLVSEAEAV